MDNRYYCVSDMSTSSRVVLSESESRHCANVRRMSAGDKCVLFNGDGYDYHSTIIDVAKKGVQLSIDSKTKNLNTTDTRVTLYIGATKNDALDDSISMAVQMNVSEIKIFYSVYTNVKIDDKKLNKLKSNIIQDCKQCERSDIPDMRIITYAQMLSEITSHDLILLAYEHAKKMPAVTSADKRVAVIIGSEGGFATEEVTDIISAGAQCISLGKTILRVPTASISLLAITQYLLGELHR